MDDKVPGVGEDWLSDELNIGIARIKEALEETKVSDTFWYRYWSGYLKAYESLLEKSRALTNTKDMERE